MTRTITHWIAGKPHAGGTERRAPVWNPATGEQQAWVSLAAPADVQRAVKAASDAFGGWKASLFGDKHIHGAEGVSFYTRAKVVTSRWPQLEASSGGATYVFPTAI